MASLPNLLSTLLTVERTKKLSSVRNSACSPSVTVGQVYRFRHRAMPGKQRLKFIHSLRIYAQPHPVNMISKSVLSLYLATPAAVAALFVLVSTDHDDDSSMGKPPAPNWPTLRCHKWMRTIQSAPRAPLRKRERSDARAHPSLSSSIVPLILVRFPLYDVLRLGARRAKSWYLMIHTLICLYLFTL